MLGVVLSSPSKINRTRLQVRLSLMDGLAYGCSTSDPVLSVAWSTRTAVLKVVNIIQASPSIKGPPEHDETVVPGVLASTEKLGRSGRRDEGGKER